MSSLVSIRLAHMFVAHELSHRRIKRPTVGGDIDSALISKTPRCKLRCIELVIILPAAKEQRPMWA